MLIFVYFAFMIGYFLLLTVILPSNVLWDPDWIKEGSFAEYSVEDPPSGMNGTYSWKIIAINNIDGRKTAFVNETFKGTTHWDHVDNIPSNGRIISVTVRKGEIEGLILWFNRYYNQILLDRSFFLGTEKFRYEGIYEGKVSFQGEIRDFVQVTPGSWREACYDKATGLLLFYRWTLPKLGTVFVSLKSTNVSDSINLTNQPNGLKIVSDLLLVAPLFVIPWASALVSLFLIRQKGICFSRRFWLWFIILNGLLLALLADWPVRIPKPYYPYQYGYSLLVWITGLNIAFWIITLGVAVLLTDLKVLPLVCRRTSLPHKHGFIKV